MWIKIFALLLFLLTQFTPAIAQVAEPIISVPGGTLFVPTQVAIYARPGARIFFTLDGSPASVRSPEYTGVPIDILYSQTISAIAVQNGTQSNPVSRTYTLDATNWPAPSPSDTTAPVINLELPTATTP